MAELRCSDGTVVQISEETEAELRKAFEPKHVWVHGDVFDDGDGAHPKIYIEVNGEEPRVFHLSGGSLGGEKGTRTTFPASAYTDWCDATFLFNIKDKL